MIYVFDHLFMPLFIVNYIIITFDKRIVPNNLVWYACTRCFLVINFTPFQKCIIFTYLCTVIFSKEAYLYLLFHHTENKYFQGSTPKNQMLMLGFAQTSYFGLWDTCIIPSKFQLAFHIYYVNYENTLTCKRISSDSGGGGDVFFLFPICIIQKVTVLAPK